MELKLDHLLWGCADLSSGRETFARLTGVPMAGGGAHRGFGTHNDLASLGDGLYFEAIAPDPAQSEHGKRARDLAALDTPRLVTFAVRGNDLEAYRDRARGLSLATSDIVKMGRTRPDGITLKWRVVYIEDDEWKDTVPFIIDWQASEHPSLTTPKGCTLNEFAAVSPMAPRLKEIYSALEIPVAVQSGEVAGFRASISTPNGPVVLS